jgi:hypothetical protein
MDGGFYRTVERAGCSWYAKKFAAVSGIVTDAIW